MPASNTSPSTALLVTAGGSQTVSAADVQLAPTGSGYASTCDATQRHALWFKYHTHETEFLIAIGVQGVPIGANYNPQVSIWIGTPPSLTQYIIQEPPGGFINRFCESLAHPSSGTGWFEVPVQPSTTYYIQVTDANSSLVDHDLVVRAETAPTGLPQAGDIIITDDSYGFPGAVINSVDGSLRAFRSEFGGADSAAILRSGSLAVQHHFAGGSSLAHRNDVEILNTATWARLGSIYTPSPSNPVSLYASRTAFYGFSRISSGNYKLQKISASGVLGTSWTIPTDAGIPLMAAPDDSYFYLTDDVLFDRIVRFNLTTGLLDGDFASSFGNEGPIFGSWAPLTDRYLFIYAAFFGVTTTVRQFTSSGTLVSSTTLGYRPHLISGDPTTDQFWTWDGGRTFKRYDLVSMALLQTLTGPQVDAFSGGPHYVDPFVISDSCPLIVMPRRPPRPPIPPRLSKPCCQERETLPEGASGGTSGDVLPAIDPRWTPSCEGGGLVPQAADLSDSEMFDV